MLGSLFVCLSVYLSWFPCDYQLYNIFITFSTCTWHSDGITDNIRLEMKYWMTHLHSCPSISLPFLSVYYFPSTVCSVLIVYQLTVKPCFGVPCTSTKWITAIVIFLLNVWVMTCRKDVISGNIWTHIWCHRSLSQSFHYPSFWFLKEKYVLSCLNCMSSWCTWTRSVYSVKSYFRYLLLCQRGYFTLMFIKLSKLE